MSFSGVLVFVSGAGVGVAAGLQLWMFVLPMLAAVFMSCVSLLLLDKGDPLALFIVVFFGILVGDWFWRMEYRFRMWVKGTTRPVTTPPVKPHSQVEKED
jgi:hypothetical protein